MKQFIIKTIWKKINSNVIEVRRVNPSQAEVRPGEDECVEAFFASLEKAKKERKKRIQSYADSDLSIKELKKIINKEIKTKFKNNEFYVSRKKIKMFAQQDIESIIRLRKM